MQNFTKVFNLFKTKSNLIPQILPTSAKLGNKFEELGERC